MIVGGSNLQLPTVEHTEAIMFLRNQPTASADCVITDPPYPGIKREYGFWTEAEWFAMMTPVVEECRRVVKPSGSAVFIIQPNSERVGRMRLWWLRFMLQWGESWGLVQDAWWWNHTALPGGGEGNRRGLLRPSVKPCVWLGMADCYRDRNAVLWNGAQAKKSIDAATRMGRTKKPCGMVVNESRMALARESNGGVTPFNLLPVANNHKGCRSEAGDHGHGAGTPVELVRWWVRYICPPGGRVLDPFMGSGTTALAAMAEGRTAAGSERMAKYVQIARARIAEAAGKPITPTPQRPPRTWMNFGDLDTNYYADQFRVSKI